jgi:pantoate--beta-alanine ligase
MKIIETISQMTEWSKATKLRGEKIAFVPTMGALHSGHLSLVRIAKEKASQVVVSIFVNPLQFGPKEDFERYPRPLERDIAFLDKEGISLLYLPFVTEMYSPRFQTAVYLKELSQTLCGKHREGHFDGVATIVLKLFHIVNPDFAIFGDKDYQQRRIIEQMVSDLNLDIQIIGAPIVRESDGLAMSSRNIYLSHEEREKAAILFKSLKVGEELCRAGEKGVSKIIACVSQMIDSERPTKVDYIAVCDAMTLHETAYIDKPSILAVAVYFGKTRLIDNVVLEPNK